MSTPTESFQIPLAAAEVYEERFVPAIFAEWAPRLLDHAGVHHDRGRGQDLLDVACGTGIVARTAAPRVSPGGTVTGLDLNEAMLTVARRATDAAAIQPAAGTDAAAIEWRQGDAAALPFDDGRFDTVVCQMALMFFSDRLKALAEMGRVVRAGGTVALCVPAALDDQPAYRTLVEVAARHAGPEALSLLGTYWACGDLAELQGWCGQAGLAVAATATLGGTARFPSIDAMVATEVEGSPLIERISDEVYAALRDDARAALASFATADGRVEAPLVGHLVAATTG